MAEEFQDIGAMLAALKPDEPVYTIHFRQLRRAAESFLSQFPGDVLYAVNANPHGECLRAFYAGGIRHFAVASLPELRAVKARFPDASCHFTHPVKSVTSIREAAHKYGVTHFAVDHADELAKIIVHATPIKPIVTVRLALPKNNPGSAFGCGVTEAAALMRVVSAEGLGIGLGFDLGVQGSQPASYRQAFELAGSVMRAASLEPELIDVGSGFPADCAAREAPLLADYCEVIRDGLSRLRLHHPVQLLCVPSRALLAAGMSLIAKVELKHGSRLYLNDGVYGGLAELRFAGTTPPLRAWRINGSAQCLTSAADGFSLYGPSGDHADRLAGPFALPADIRMGDYIEIGRMGGVGRHNIRRDFGGFLSAASVIVNDPAFPS